jgi:tRNA 5-methylaminomethyl-2-thiouridine biosynthesis bifunctional protein
MAVTAPLALPYARVQFRADQPFSPDDNDVYGPGFARAAQTESVFMAGNQLPQRWQGRRHFTIVETGFGSGHNFLATWAAWQADSARSERLTFVSFEHRPWHPDDLQRCHAMGPHTDLAAQLIEQWPLPCRGPHLRHFDEGRVTLLMWWGDVADTLPQADIPFDACYLDGFSPDRNPAMWSPVLMQTLAQHALPDATFASYTVAATVRDALSATGAAVHRAPGLHKSKVLHGTWAARPPPLAATPKTVAILGAGLAGCSVAAALARQGVAVTVFDPADHVASGASGAPRMVVRPWLTRRPTVASDLSVLGFLHAVATYRGHPAWKPCGVQQRSKPDDLPARMATALSEQGWPADLMKLISPADAAPAWFEATLGGALDARAWCQSQVTHPQIELRLGERQTVAALEHRYDNVVVACAGATPEALDQPLPMSRTRGQITTLAAGTLPNLRRVHCGDGYVAPLADGGAVVGASYDRDDDPQLRAESHAENLGRLQRLTGEARTLAHVSGGWVGFRAAWPDRLPALGALDDDASAVWLATGYASRGAVWAPLLGEVLAAQLLRQPIPLGRDLQHALRPGRFSGS